MSEHTIESLERRYRKIIPDDDARCQCHRWRPLAADALTLLRAKDVMNTQLLEAAQMFVKRGHHDTCQAALVDGNKYPCNCGYDIFVKALSNDSEGG